MARIQWGKYGLFDGKINWDCKPEREKKGCFTNGNAKDWIRGDVTSKKGGYYTIGSHLITSPFNKHRIPDSIAEKYGRKDLNRYGDGGVQVANQKMLAIWAYASKREANGTPLDDDGYWFRGKGILQITWRENYEHAQAIIGAKFIRLQTYSAENIDIVTHVKKFTVDHNDSQCSQTQEESDEFAIVAGCGDWAHENQVHSIGNVAQTGSEDKDVDKVTAIINLGTDAASYAARRNYFKTTKVIFKVAECTCKKEHDSDLFINGDVVLHFTGQSARESDLSGKTKNILKEVGKVSGNKHIFITSTARTPHDQARIMYDNCESKGAATQRAIYKAPGQRVVNVYSSGKRIGDNRDNIIQAMEAKIIEEGPPNVSQHIADFRVMNTFDISYGKLRDKQKFWNEMNKRSELDKILVENNCYHIQINQQ